MGVNVGLVIFWVFLVGWGFFPCTWKEGRDFQLFLCPWSLWDSRVVFPNTGASLCLFQGW